MLTCSKAPPLHFSVMHLERVCCLLIWYDMSFLISMPSIQCSFCHFCHWQLATCNLSSIIFTLFQSTAVLIMDQVLFHFKCYLAEFKQQLDVILSNLHISFCYAPFLSISPLIHFNSFQRPSFVAVIRLTTECSVRLSIFVEDPIQSLVYPFHFLSIWNILMAVHLSNLPRGYLMNRCLKD